MFEQTTYRLAPRFKFAEIILLKFDLISEDTIKRVAELARLLEHELAKEDE